MFLQLKFEYTMFDQNLIWKDKRRDDTVTVILH